MGRRKRAERKGQPKDDRAKRSAEALAAMKEVLRQGSFPKDSKAIFEVLIGESDRGAIILVGSMIEDLLAKRIIENMRNGVARRDDLLRQGGALNAFHHKLAVALAMGLIDDDTAEGVDIFRQLRNDCAHSRMEVSFLKPEIIEVLTIFMNEEGATSIRQNRNAQSVRYIFSLLAIYHFFRVHGQSHEQAQSVIDDIRSTTPESAEKASLEASPETPSAQPGSTDHQDQTT